MRRNKGERNAFLEEKSQKYETNSMEFLRSKRIGKWYVRRARRRGGKEVCQRGKAL